MKTHTFLLAVSTLIACTAYSQNKPFPQKLDFVGCIKPNHVTQAQLDSTVAAYYDYWKEKYLQPSKYFPGAYYIQGDNTGGKKKDKGTSEGHGYGMVITALMAGHDADAQKYYNGLYKMFDTHRSSENNELMGWLIDAKETGSGKYSSAADGDLDIAYSLLLAHNQWGSNGSINYLQEALDMINNGIKVDLISSTGRIMLGDWGKWSDPNNTRPSDWMLTHLHTFYNFTNDKTWLAVLNKTHELISTIQTHYSPITGLMPDFVIGDTARPAAPGFLEGANDGDYNYNAGRCPLRYVMEYAHFGNAESKTYVDKIVNWVTTKYNHDPTAIHSGFTLSGEVIGDYYDALFVAPFVAASVTDPANQQFLNDGWNSITADRENYFSDTYNLLCQLFISGNWWIPSPSDICPSNKTTSINSNLNTFEEENPQ